MVHGVYSMLLLVYWPSVIMILMETTSVSKKAEQTLHAVSLSLCTNKYELLN